jgi:hypothetical protein
MLPLVTSLILVNRGMLAETLLEISIRQPGLPTKYRLRLLKNIPSSSRAEQSSKLSRKSCYDSIDTPTTAGPSN